MKKLTLGILAHVDAGKTTLSEALLYVNGALRKLGRVDNRDAFLDTYAMERERGITIFSKQAILPMGDTEIILLDTPGHMDFSAEMERTLQVLDYAILVISGADGVQGHTRTLWKLLHVYRIPVFLFVNKMDQEGTDKEALLEKLKHGLSENCVDFTGKIASDFGEDLAVCSEELLSEYLEAEKLSVQSIRKAIQGRQVFPVYFGSALKLYGIKELIEGILEYAAIPDYPREFGARVFKIARDSQGNRLTYLKVTGGRLKIKEELNGEKVNQIRIYSGEKFEAVKEAEAGSVCAVTGLSKPLPGDGLGAEEGQVLPLLEPVLTYGVRIPEEYDTAQVLPKLRQLEEEEPGLHITYQEALKQIQVQLMGEVQIEVFKHLIWERFQIPVELDTGKIVYKETIQNTVEGVGHFEPLRHYAEVHLILEPQEPGSGLKFATECSEDMLDKNWQRLVLTHLREKEHKGVLTGSAITDMKITLAAGRAHQKHTEGGDFRQAVYRAVRQGLKEAVSVLLEPWYTFLLEVPEKLLGRAMTDLEQRHGFFEAPEYLGETAVLKGTVPVVTMQDYPQRLRAYSQGLGRISCELKGYFPCHNAQEVIEQTAYDAEADLENPAASVFCTHGAGFVVPWYQVKEYMHLESVLPGPDVTENSMFSDGQPGVLGSGLRAGQQADTASIIDQEEIERIMNRTFYANKKQKERPQKKPVPAEPVYRAFRKKETKAEYLLVDGYNIIFAWEELSQLARSNVDAARERLKSILCNFQAVRGCELILVFDAYRVQGHDTEMSDYHNIHVVFTREAETADQYIEKFVHENRKNYEITVATSDGLEQIIIRGQGCKLLSARELKEEVERESNRITEEYRQSQPRGKHYLGEIAVEKK